MKTIIKALKFGNANSSMQIGTNNGTISNVHFHSNADIEPLVDLVRSFQISGSIRSWLKAPNATMNHYDALEKRLEKTGLWFTQQPCFHNWIKSRQSFLWVKGFAGCGKSILCSTAIQDTFSNTKNQKGVGIAFFYFSFADQGKQDVCAMLRTLLLQLSGQHKDGEKELEDLHRVYANGTPPTAKLIASLENMANKFQDVYIFLDALDESPRYTKRDQVLNTLTRLRKALPSLHLLVTSRDELDIQDSLNPGQNQVVTMDNVGVRRDIANFIAQKLKNDRGLRQWEGQSKRIRETIAEKAQGVFRYAEYQLNALRKCPIPTKKHLDRCLESLPRDLDETYERALCNIEEDFVDDLIHAYLIEIGVPENIHGEGITMVHLKDVCLGLISVTEHTAFPNPFKNPKAEHDTSLQKSIVRIAHFSVQEYLLSKRIGWGKAASFSLDEGSSHAEITKVCLTCIMSLPFLVQEKSNDWYTLGSESFLHFAAHNWEFHYRCSTDQSSDLEDLVLRLLDSSSDHFRHWVIVRDLYRLPNGRKYEIRDPPSPIYYASRMGLEQVLRGILLIEKGRGMDVAAIINGGTIHKRALPAACQEGHEKIVQILLENGADPNLSEGKFTRPHMPFHMACHEGHIEVVKTMLEYGADANMEDGDGCTPLYAARHGNHEMIVQILLDYGADPDGENRSPHSRYEDGNDLLENDYLYMTRPRRD